VKRGAKTTPAIHNGGAGRPSDRGVLVDDLGEGLKDLNAEANALRDRFDTSSLYRGQAFVQPGSQDIDHLAIAVIDALQLAADIYLSCQKDPDLWTF
jgi:hypothetical protein